MKKREYTRNFFPCLYSMAHKDIALYGLHNWTLVSITYVRYVIHLHVKERLSPKSQDVTGNKYS
jgi:hypothetical protein